MLVAVSHVSAQYVIVGKDQIFPTSFLPEPGKVFPTEEAVGDYAGIACRAAEIRKKYGRDDRKRVGRVTR